MFERRALERVAIDHRRPSFVDDVETLSRSPPNKGKHMRYYFHIKDDTTFLTETALRTRHALPSLP